MHSLAEEDEVFTGDISLDEVSCLCCVLLLLCVYGLLDVEGDETRPSCIVSEVRLPH